MDAGSSPGRPNAGACRSPSRIRCSKGFRTRSEDACVSAAAVRWAITSLQATAPEPSRRVTRCAVTPGALPCRAVQLQGDSGRDQRALPALMERAPEASRAAGGRPVTAALREASALRDAMFGTRPPMMFGHAVNALLLHGLPQPLPDRCLRRMRHLGVDPDLIQPAYPIELWVALLELLREELFSELPVAEGYRQLGRHMVNGFVKGPMGRAVAGSVRLAGPDRMLRSLSWVLRSASNFMETS